MLNQVQQREEIFSSPVIELEIPGAPFGKQRPKVFNGRGVTPEKTVSYENLVKLLYKEKYHDLMLEGPLSMRVELVYPIPKSTSKKNKAAMLDGLILPTKKPDADNCIKILADSLNKIAYQDDTQIVEVYCIKHYGEIPKAILTLNKFTIQTKIEVQKWL